ncbi:unnamed protein product [Bursaphelenchus okinawaensis]|uniref:Uncharacterized protein n=1 Tax=Bursaphelenchus okinawaensis TaxID=465554 RepID=A0A811LCY4_9BILA|nr:unnamed protein product [Bursaphelenchus okinawaensis]CAG9120444.1 unnamed protein product [Bursaphelenchus okinawaensis]
MGPFSRFRCVCAIMLGKESVAEGGAFPPPLVSFARGPKEALIPKKGGRCEADDFRGEASTTSTVNGSHIP